jgi:SAM-dependent methyltransferase
MRRLLSAIARILLTERQREWMRRKQFIQRERRRYQFSATPLSGADSPWADVTIVEDGELISRLFLAGLVGEIRRSTRRLPTLLYSRRKRATWALVHGLTLARTLPRQKVPFDLLLVGYGMDTWDAQFLLDEGYPVRVTSVDVADPDLDSRYWRVLADRTGARYVQADARELADALASEFFDAVSICRASVDLLPPADLLSVWEQCMALLKPGGLLLAPVKGVELSQGKAKAISAHLERGTPLEDGHTYRTRIGTFSLPIFAYGAYVPSPERLGTSALLEQVLEAAGRFVDRHDLAVYQGLFAGLSGSTQERLLCLATHNDQITPSLDLGQFNHPFEVVALDYMTSDTVDNPFFSCRATILCRK